MSQKNKHVCNINNNYYRYCQLNNLPLIALSKEHCIFCGDKITLGENCK